MKGLKLVLTLLCVLCCSFTAFAAQAALNVIPVDMTADGNYVLLTNEFNHGLVLLNNETGKTVTITDGRNAGYYATISPDQRYVCYKAFMWENDSYLQSAMLYDIASKKSLPLTGWEPMVGTPAVAQDGTVAYTVGDELIVLSPYMAEEFRMYLGYHANLLDFSADGANLTFNDANGQIVVLNLETSAMKTVDGIDQFWGPKFSPNGDKIVSRTVNGKTAYVDAVKGEIKSVHPGQALGWVDNDTIAYLEQEIDEKEGKVKQSKLVMVNTADNSTTVTELNNGDAAVAIKGNNAAIARLGKLDMGKLSNKHLNTWPNKVNIPVPGKDVLNEKEKPLNEKDGEIGIQSVYSGTYSVYLTGMQYIHQVYDTANNFNGHWACGATSALMAIQYYGVLATHPITVDVPYSHTSNYGWYISNVYTYGRTFNIYGADPNGNYFAGGYGYIIQNNWEDTKGHMAEYIRYHGRASSVDWSPTFTEMKNEINANHPFVVLTSLTTSGHYITCRGYYKTIYSGVFNDPYGNKNTGYMNYSGQLVAYDWPGYNNGYANLTTVHCFIYCR